MGGKKACHPCTTREQCTGKAIENGWKTPSTQSFIQGNVVLVPGIFIESSKYNLFCDRTLGRCTYYCVDNYDCEATYSNLFAETRRVSFPYCTCTPQGCAQSECYVDNDCFYKKETPICENNKCIKGCRSYLSCCIKHPTTAKDCTGANWVIGNPACYDKKCIPWLSQRPTRHDRV